MKKKIFCFDIDNTICITKGINYSNSKPKIKIIKLVNALYEQGHTINIFTARFMGRNDDDIKKANKQGYVFTEKQLKRWGVRYSKLFLGKPSADIYFDDKAFGYNDRKFENYLKKLVGF